MLSLDSLIATYAIPAFWALVVFIVGRIVAKIVTRSVGRMMSKQGVDQTLIKFAKNLLFIALMAFVILASLDRLGVETTSFAAVIAAAGLAIGFALQSSLSNFASGIMLIIFRPFKVGDYVQAGGTSGTVEEIQIFTTQLLSLGNNTIIIPNGQITSTEIINYTAKDTRRVDLVIGVSYDDDIRKVRPILEELMNANNLVLTEPNPTVGLLELGDNSVNLAVRPWAKPEHYWDVFFQLQEAIKIRFDEEGITFPFPQRDVHHHTEDATPDAE